MESPFLVLLEQAERAAAERRQLARLEAERRLEQARDDVRAIEAGAAERMTAAIARAQERIRAEALREVAAAELALAGMEAEGRSDSAESIASFDRVVDEIVGAVLGESARQ